MKTQLIREAVELLEGNRETRTVKQIIIRAGMSKNNRNYPLQVVKQATQLFEDVKTYADHPSKADLKNRPERSISDITGWISDVSFDESVNAIVGTRHFSKTSAGQDAWELAQQVVFEGAPSTLFGASINAMGRGEKKDGILEVAEITKAISVDDVTSPAAGGGFEKLIASDDGIIGAILNEMTFLEFFEARPDYIARIQKEMKQERQDKALKAAKADARQHLEALKQLQVDTKQVNENLITALINKEKVENELTIEKTLHKVRLPAEWRESLRLRLIDATPDKWEHIIKEEQQKAKRLNKSSVKGTSRQVQSKLPLTQSIKDTRLVTESDDFNTWLKRQPNN